MSDQATAAAFASSWNNLPAGSVYTREQFLEWIEPLTPEDIEGREILELGFGNGSLLVHAAACRPRRLVGVELGDTLEPTRANLRDAFDGELDLIQGDLTVVEAGRFDVVYCIGVIHHLSDPSAGFASVIRHTRPGGRFHCWVYGREGNGVVIALVEPIRRIASRLPWWFTKYLVALPLAVPFYAYAKLAAAWGARLRGLGVGLPLDEYCRWIAKREFAFFHHVAFDQLVTPQTVYIPREQVESWLASSDVEPGSAYIVQRNGNSWKFGGLRSKQ